MTDAPAADVSEVLIPGPWQHRMVSAAGVRLHLAEAGRGPLVVLLHGFPQMWWAWRHQLTALAQAGFRAVAVDLRGFGASDKPPLGYDSFTMTADVAALIRTLGAPRAHVVGQGLGGALAWAMPVLEPAVTHSVVSLATPHPNAMRAASMASWAQARANTWMLPYQRPFTGESALSSGPDGLRALFSSWSLTGQALPDTDLAVYARALQQPFAARCAAEAARWFTRSPFTPTGIRLAAAMRAPITVPSMLIHGDLDACMLPAAAVKSARHITGEFERHRLADVGHFPGEEAPHTVNELLIDWLRRR